LNGTHYEFVDPDADIAELPKWIIDALQAGTEGAAPVDGQSDVPEGMRNEHLTRIAGRLRSNGADFSAIRADLVEINHRWCKPPLPEYEVDGIAKSISRYPPDNGIQNGKSQPSTRTNPLWWFPLDTRWWNENQNIAQMDAEQIGWYVGLLLKAWPAGGRLPADRGALAKLAQARSVKAFKNKCELIMAEFEPREIDGTDYLVHPMLEERYGIQLGNWEQRKQAGQASAEARKKQQNAGVSA
jgi:uncharacterized protein YdaU (DUF1376 family)